MNRLDEIKETLEKVKKREIHEDQMHFAYAEDVDYLIEELETLQSKLEWIQVELKRLAQ